MKQTTTVLSLKKDEHPETNAPWIHQAIRWFFDIYIQKVNTTLKVESEIQMRISVITIISRGASHEDKIDQATKST